MAKIYCNKCGADTGYTDETATVDKPRSIVPDGSQESCRVHLCKACWDILGGPEHLGRG